MAAKTQKPNSNQGFFARQLRQLLPGDDAVKLGVFLDLPILSGPTSIGGNSKRANGGAIGRILKLRIPGEIADEDYTVEGSACHI